VRLATARPLEELASGVDAFYLSGTGALSSALVEDLDEARALAAETKVTVPFGVGDISFGVAGRGLLRYAYRLEHTNGVVGLTTSSALPTVRVQPKASFIHAVGVREALGWFRGHVESFVGPVEWKASRVDLFMDSQGWDLDAAHRGRFVCRARDRWTFESNEAFTGVRFGSGGGAVKARIYDKSEESRLKGSDWWPDKWGSGYRPNERVLRVEFEVNRELMRQVGLSTPEEVLEELPRLWAYLTDEWLTYRRPTSDETRSRWPVAVEWQNVQNASLRDEALGLERVYAGEASGSIRRMLPSLRGYLSSAGAVLGARTLEDTLHRVGRVLASDEDESGIAFVDRLREKHVALGLA
jgi:hypothetical protein